MRRLFEGGHYNAQPWDCAAPIRGRLLNGVRRLFEEIRYSLIAERKDGGYSVHEAITLNSSQKTEDFLHQH